MVLERALHQKRNDRGSEAHFEHDEILWLLRELMVSYKIGSIRVNTDRGVGVNTDRWLTIHMSKSTGL